ncbi:site-specific integrase [Fusobacterium varium]|uniref:site-specific integrase n=1 Tax=Fusobacterium varium TaxID=856 RepID=UPI003F0626B5
MTLRDMLELYFRDLKTRVRSSSYIVTYTTTNNMFKQSKEILDKDLKEITVEDIVLLKEKCCIKYNQNLVTRLIKLIKKLLKEAFLLGYTKVNIGDLLNPLKFTEHKVTEVITLEEFENIIKYIQKDKEDNTEEILYLKLLFKTGMRNGEARGLLWEDIDFNEGTVFIRKSVYSLTHGNFIINKPKTKQSTRIIHIPKSLLEELRIYREITEYKDNKDFIFCKEKNIPRTSGFNKSTLKRACKDLEIKISHHGLRHSHATFLIQNNIPVHLVQYRLGHSDIRTTLKTYTHLKTYNEEVILEILK